MDLDATFFALSDPTRRAILEHLAEREHTVLELVEPFSMSQPAISRHLKILEGAGLVSRRVEGSKRPCRLTPDGLAAVDEWLSMLRATLESNYRRLDALLADIDP